MDPQPIATSITAYLEGQRPESLPMQLERRYGLGSDPRKRRALYRRIAEWIERVGDDAWTLLEEANLTAATARTPDRYFCAAINAKMAEWSRSQLRKPEATRKERRA